MLRESNDCMEPDAVVPFDFALVLLRDIILARKFTTDHNVPGATDDFAELA